MVQTFEWLQAMLRISMAPGLPAGIELPQILCYDELETMDTMMWLGMQNVIIVNDRYAQADMYFALQHAACTTKREFLFSKVSPAHVMAYKRYSSHSNREREVVYTLCPASSLMNVPTLQEGGTSVAQRCRYTHPAGRGGFASVEHGQQFREAAYKEAHLSQPAPWKLGGAPRTITLLSAVTGEMVRTLIAQPAGIR